MKVKYIGESGISLTNGKVYDVIAVERGLFRIVDDTEEDYLFYPEQFEIQASDYVKKEEQIEDSKCELVFEESKK